VEAAGEMAMDKGEKGTIDLLYGSSTALPTKKKRKGSSALFPFAGSVEKYAQEKREKLQKEHGDRAIKQKERIRKELEEEEMKERQMYFEEAEAKPGEKEVQKEPPQNHHPPPQEEKQSTPVPQHKAAALSDIPLSAASDSMGGGEMVNQMSQKSDSGKEQSEVNAEASPSSGEPEKQEIHSSPQLPPQSQQPQPQPDLPASHQSQPYHVETLAVNDTQSQARTHSRTRSRSPSLADEKAAERLKKELLILKDKEPPIKSYRDTYPLLEGSKVGGGGESPPFMCCCLF